MSLRGHVDAVLPSASPHPASLWLWAADDRRSALVLRTTQGSIARLLPSPDGSTLVAIAPDGSVGCFAPVDAPPR